MRSSAGEAGQEGGRSWRRGLRRTTGLRIVLPRLNVSLLFLLARLCGVLSFSFLAVAIGTDYWYILEVAEGGPGNSSGVPSGDFNSHSGLWRICEGRNGCVPLIDPFGTESSEVPPSLHHLICLHRVFVVILPLSLILLVFGWICGLISSLSQNFQLLVLTGSFFLLGGYSLHFFVSIQEYPLPYTSLGEGDNTIFQFEVDFLLRNDVAELVPQKEGVHNMILCQYFLFLKTLSGMRPILDFRDLKLLFNRGKFKMNSLPLIDKKD